MNPDDAQQISEAFAWEPLLSLRMLSLLCAAVVLFWLERWHPHRLLRRRHFLDRLLESGIALFRV